MVNFDGVRFNGTFRDYQQNVLNNSDKHLKDGKIHIVAAPGSGKTILGLELIRKLGKPALILAPSVTIRQQWGERFEENFLPKDKEASDYVSFDLKKPKLLTCITYQALHAAFNKKSLDEGPDDDSVEVETKEDFTNFELINTINKAGITTICLDEAHHLRSEWQKALEGFVTALGKSVKTIALTATPPYDSTPAEWKKYTDICGEIDEEIFVPQLVAQKTLCPHQDYIYFSYPTSEEIDLVKRYKERATVCANEILKSGIMKTALDNSNIVNTYKDKEEMILDNAKGFIALFCLARLNGSVIPKKLIKLVSPCGRLPDYNLKFAERAFQFVIDNPNLFGADISAKLKTTLIRNALIDKKTVCLKSNDEIKRMLITSMGKLGSINTIVKSENKCLGKSLRMLILTDYIKKDLKKIIGTNGPISAMGTVPIFESVRRNCPNNANLAVLSGTLVIIPDSIISDVSKIAENRGISYTVKHIENTVHSEIVFSGSNKNKVSIITEAFQKGLINILIGTKSLLGEGWDSPCINSLILASFVGSFMLSNQMRGRAIRIDKNNPTKVSNIWHLATVEPHFVYQSVKDDILYGTREDETQLQSDDFDTIERRFDCFLAPAYHSNVIESGLKRVDILTSPYNEAGIANINREMLELSEDRTTMSNRWQGAVGESTHPEVTEVNEVPKDVQPNSFIFLNGFAMIIELLVFIGLYTGIQSLFNNNMGALNTLLCIALLILTVLLEFRGLRIILHFISPKKTIKSLSNCVLKTLIDIGEIESSNAMLKVKEDNAGTSVLVTLISATEHEKSVFSKAVCEMLSAIDNPRYVIMTRFLGHKSYLRSYACPTIIGNKKENVDVFASHLKKVYGTVDVRFTRNEEGRKVLIKCRERSLINANESIVNRKKSATKWD